MSVASIGSFAKGTKPNGGSEATFFPRGEEDWLRNEYRLNNFMTVEPVFPAPTSEEVAWAKRQQKEQAMLAAFGAVMSSNCPLDPEHPWDLVPGGFGRPDPDRLHFVTENSRVYNLDRKEAEAAYEAHLAGDKTAVRSLLQAPVANALRTLASTRVRAVSCPRAR